MSLYIGVGFFWANNSSRRNRGYRTAIAAVDVEHYSASAVARAVVFCIFDLHEIGDLLYSISMPDVDCRDERLPQSESATDSSFLSFVDV